MIDIVRRGWASRSLHTEERNKSVQNKSITRADDKADMNNAYNDGTKHAETAPEQKRT